MIRRLIAFCILLALLAALGCGQKGPLYLPQNDDESTSEAEAESQE